MSGAHALTTSVSKSWKRSSPTWRVFEGLGAHVTWYFFCFLLLSRGAAVGFHAVLVKALERWKRHWTLWAALLLPRREGTAFLMLYQTALKVKRFITPLTAVRHRHSLPFDFCFGVFPIIILRVCSWSFLLYLRFRRTVRIWQRPCFQYRHKVKVCYGLNAMPNYHIITWTETSMFCEVLHQYVWGVSWEWSAEGWQTAAGTVNWQTLSHDSKLSRQSAVLTPAHHQHSDSSGETRTHKNNVM